MNVSKRPMFGIVVLAIGLIPSVGVWNLILSYQGESRQMVDIRYIGPHNYILFPAEFEVFKVPDYLLRYLILGVFTSTVGLTIAASHLLKRLVQSENP